MKETEKMPTTGKKRKLEDDSYDNITIPPFKSARYFFINEVLTLSAVF